MRLTAHQSGSVTSILLHYSKINTFMFSGSYTETRHCSCNIHAIGVVQVILPTCSVPKY